MFIRGLCGLALAIVAGAGTASAQIHWETKLDRASAAAREHQQPMLIEFWADWCEPCQEMDRDVYADERVAAAMKKVQPVRVDVDRESRLGRKYDISGMPTLLVTDSYGRELFRYAGALPLDRMLRLLEALPADISAINGHSAALAKKKDDFGALSGMARALRDAGFYRSSTEYCDRALETKDGRRPGGARDELLAIRARNSADLERPRAGTATPRG